jgi:hypothetical protein
VAEGDLVPERGQQIFRRDQDAVVRHQRAVLGLSDSAAAEAERGMNGQGREAEKNEKKQELACNA